MYKLIHILFYDYNEFVDIDYCYDSPCVNGECVDLQDGYQCNCEEGWTGQNCQDSNSSLINIRFCVAKKEKVLYWRNIAAFTRDFGLVSLKLSKYFTL